LHWITFRAARMVSLLNATFFPLIACSYLIF